MTETVAEAQAILADVIGKLVGPQSPVSATEAIAKLDRYVDLLLKWNRVYNLTAISDPEQILTHHLIDSLAVVDPMDICLNDLPAPALLDIGSGAGLPGVPLAVVRPHWTLTLLDSNSKKTAFLQQVASELSLANVRTVTSRAESYTGRNFDLIVARAFSSLADLVLKTRHLLKSSGCWAAMKGTLPTDEIDALPDDVSVAWVGRLAVPGLDAERHLLLLKVKPQ